MKSFTVRDLLSLFTEKTWQKVNIWDVDTNETIVRGLTIYEIDDKILDLEIESIDTMFNETQFLSINVSTHRF